MKTRLLLEMQDMVEALSPAEAKLAAELAPHLFPSSKGRLRDFYLYLLTLKIAGIL